MATIRVETFAGNKVASIKCTALPEPTLEYLIQAVNKKIEAVKPLLKVGKLVNKDGQVLPPGFVFKDEDATLLASFHPPHCFATEQDCICAQCGRRPECDNGDSEMYDAIEQWALCCDSKAIYCAKCRIQYTHCPYCDGSHATYWPDDTKMKVNKGNPKICFGKFIGIYNTDQIWRPNYDPQKVEPDIDVPEHKPQKATVLPGEDAVQVQVYVGDVNSLYMGYREDCVKGVEGFDETPLTGDDGGFAVYWFCHECKQIYETADK